MLSSLHVSFMDRGWKPNVEISPNCPRCGSSNTKFCYYNNYSLTQPRYFCKGCRRYWTKGGSLRNVPVGGGCRKNRRGKSLRVASTNDVAHSKSLGYFHGYKGFESCSSSTMPDGSHIDLALVYANFLNPQHQESKITSTSDFKIQELGNDHFDPSLEFTTIIGAGCVNGIPNNSSMEASLNENDRLMYQQANDYKIQECTSVTTHDTINYGLPPLPGEEILWPNSCHMMMEHNQTLQETQEAILGPETQDPNTLLFGNWSPFDLS